MIRNSSTVLLSSLSLVLLLSTVAVRAADPEVEKVCAETPHPDLCVQCIDADHSRFTNSLPELTYDVLFCMMSEASLGHDAADLLAQQTTDPNLKGKLVTCSSTLFSSSNDLTDSLMRMQGRKDFQKAEADLESADKNVELCLQEFLKQPIVTFPPTVSSHADLAARYYDVAHVFFGLLRKQNQY